MPTASAILLDTHVVLWWQAGGERLSKAASTAIADASTVLVSPISAWEIGNLVEKGRVGVDRPLMHWIDALFREQRVDALELSPLVAAQAASLADFHGDPADRIIYASAQFARCPLVTKDERLGRYASVQGDIATIW